MNVDNILSHTYINLIMFDKVYSIW
jgi:hypothetical protein